MVLVNLEFLKVFPVNKLLNKVLKSDSTWNHKDNILKWPITDQYTVYSKNIKVMCFPQCQEKQVVQTFLFTAIIK